MTKQTKLSPANKPVVKPMGRTIGAEIADVDLSAPMSEADFAAIRDAFYRYSVIFFRGQKITEEEQIAFSRRFGEQEVHVLNHYLHPQHPEILLISNIVENGRAIGIADAGRYWHSDLAYMPKPSRSAILYALEIPHADNGVPLGDTIFADVCAAYDALPEDMKARLAGLKARSSLSHRFEKIRKDGGTEQLAEDKKKEAIHPVIRTHPVTGRKLIYVNDGQTDRILDIPEAESERLLAYLCAQCIKPEYQYRHKWQVGDVLMWDNCAVQHLAVADYKLPQRRRMHRTTIAGDAPF